ncbi:MAG TPA: Gfo/Idh/MocA family oxidoreductase [Clostridia bacterium]|jgi:predicted dehydrogenase|nr:Gfo/Idh/MocA family oxidoreductase [Clostridia bacterium]HQC67851.1 Gfo/Idh/MocA family oxidoreductase [Clostridia bacterium]
MTEVRFGIIGYGNIAGTHLSFFDKNEIPDARVTAIFDTDKSRADKAREKYKGKIAVFDDEEEFFSSGLFDAILICSPHYHHPHYAIKGFEHNLHVLCEKPAGVYTKQVREMNEAYRHHKHLVFAMMYNQRTNPLYRKVRDMLLNGEYGEIRRCVWIITDWFRTQRYYDSGGWRATWAYEGGGVLLNQDPHQLDLWQWICGMPVRVRAFLGFGKFHDIEVEDDVTAYVEYPNGATGVFITSTGEAPGTNRFEISLDRGKIVIENDKICAYKLKEDLSRFIKESDKPFTAPEYEVIEYDIDEPNLQHKGILLNFVDAILNNAPLIAPGTEGISGLTISNAMHLSQWTDSWVDIPFDEELFLKHLNKRIEQSTFTKKTAKTVETDMSASF